MNSQQTRALIERLDSELEAEKRHWACELHDEMGAILTAARMSVAALHLELDLPEHLRNRVQSIDALIGDAFRVTRSIINGLRPPALDLGLVPALEWQVQDFSRRTGLHGDFSCRHEEVQVTDACAVVAFRLVQEALTNIIKHAVASNVAVNLCCDHAHVTIEIRDDGRGIELADHTKKGHFGLIGMGERARRVNGQVNVGRHADGGTMVWVKLPLDSRARA